MLKGAPLLDAARQLRTYVCTIPFFECEDFFQRLSQENRSNADSIATAQKHIAHQPCCKAIARSLRSFRQIFLTRLSGLIPATLLTLRQIYEGAARNDPADRRCRVAARTPRALYSRVYIDAEATSG